VTLWLKIASKYKVQGFDHFGSMYILHDDNTTNIRNGSAIKMAESLSVFFERNKHIKDHIPSKAYRGYFSEIYMNVAKYFFFKKNRLRSALYIITSILTSPFHKHTKYRLRVLLLTVVSNKTNIHE
jgi:hypothetical protein